MYWDIDKANKVLTGKLKLKLTLYLTVFFWSYKNNCLSRKSLIYNAILIKVLLVQYNKTCILNIVLINSNLDTAVGRLYLKKRSGVLLWGEGKRDGQTFVFPLTGSQRKREEGMPGRRLTGSGNWFIFRAHNCRKICVSLACTHIPRSTWVESCFHCGLGK